MGRQTAAYHTCDNEYSDLVNIPACQGPAAHLDENYLGQFSKEGFNLEDIKNMDECYEWMGSWFFYALYPSGFDFNDALNVGPVVGLVVFVLFIYCCCLKGGDEE